MDGSYSKVLNSNSGTDVEIYYPHINDIDSVGLMSFFLNSNSYLDSASLDFIIDGSKVFTKNLGTLEGISKVELNQNEHEDLINAMNSSSSELSFDENLDFQTIVVRLISSQTIDVTFSGLSIPYDVSLEIDQDESDIISAINAYMPSLQPESGFYKIPIPVLMDSEGSVIIHEYSMSTMASPVAISLSMSNSTETLVAGEDWYEFESKFDLSNVGITDAESHFNNSAWSSRLDFIGSVWSKGVDCSVIDSNCIAEEGVIISDFTHSFSGSEVTFNHRVRISATWPDEFALTVSSTIDMGNQLSSPAQIRFGPGWSMGIQQDIVVEKMTTKNCMLESYEEWDEGDDMKWILTFKILDEYELKPELN